MLNMEMRMIYLKLVIQFMIRKNKHVKENFLKYNNIYKFFF